MPQVEVPPRYRGPTCGEGQIVVDAVSVRGCIEAVESRHPGFQELILDPKGRLRRFVRLFLNGDALDREAIDTPVGDDDTLQILASIAGG